jgi:hypothetical protein
MPDDSISALVRRAPVSRSRPTEPAAGSMARPGFFSQALPLKGILERDGDGQLTRSLQSRLIERCRGELPPEMIAQPAGRKAIGAARCILAAVQDVVRLYGERPGRASLDDSGRLQAQLYLERLPVHLLIAQCGLVGVPFAMVDEARVVATWVAGRFEPQWQLWAWWVAVLARAGFFAEADDALDGRPGASMPAEERQRLKRTVQQLEALHPRNKIEVW